MKNLLIYVMVFFFIFCLCACNAQQNIGDESTVIKNDGYTNVEDLFSHIETAIETADFKLVENDFHSEAVVFAENITGIADAESFRGFFDNHSIEQEVMIFKADEEYLIDVEFEEVLQEISELVDEKSLNIDISSITLCRIDMYEGDTDDECVLFCKENGVWKILTLCLSA